MGKILDLFVWIGLLDREETVYYIGGSDILPPPLKGAEEQQALEGLEKGDEGQKQRLIEHNLRLVVYIARRFENTGVNLEDLISIGTIGLIKAVGTYRRDKNIRLATYGLYSTLGVFYFFACGLQASCTNTGNFRIITKIMRLHFWDVFFNFYQRFLCRRYRSKCFLALPNIVSAIDFCVSWRYIVGINMCTEVLMVTKLAQYREKLLLFKGTGELVQVSAGEAREFLLNYMDEKYVGAKDDELGISGVPNFNGETIAEVVDNGCLIIRNAKKFKEIIINGETEFMSVPEFAGKVGKSDAYVRRLCQNGRLPGVLQKGMVYLIPAHLKLSDASDK